MNEVGSLAHLPVVRLSQRAPTIETNCADATSLVRQFSMAVGPVIGGVLAGTLGFRFIFWLLTLLGGIALLFLIVFLPETLRTLAGNGSRPLKGWKYKPLVGVFAPWTKPAALDDEVGDRPPKEKLTANLFFQPMLFLLERDVACTLFFGAVIYTVFSMVSCLFSMLRI